jgi:hypothetical protein
VPAERGMQLPDAKIPVEARLGYTDTQPVFVGHYWMTVRPDRLAWTVACVDYSAGKGGPLAAYRWSGESELRRENFVSSE